jgi:glycosyltransferase involved in cell wall biosynthesis
MADVTGAGNHRSEQEGVSVCFPAYNEENTLARVIEDAHSLLSTCGRPYEIIVCNDGSKDATGAVLDELAARIPHLRAVHHPQNRGIRDTFEHLYSLARHEFVFLNSVDQQWETRILFDLLLLTADWDVIVASRIDKQYGPLRTAISWGYNRLTAACFGVRTFDAGAVKLVRREIITRFPIVSTSPFNEAERLIRAGYAGYRITEFPVTIQTRKFGRASGADARLVLQALADVGRVWWALRPQRAAARAAKRRAAMAAPPPGWGPR